MAEEDSKIRLASAIERWDSLGTLFGICVVLGLAGEYIGPVIPCRISLWFPPPAFHILVIAGVAGELLAHRKQSGASKALELLQRAESDQLRLEIARIMERAQIAGRDAANARLELERIRTPRTLNREQRLRITVSLRRFSGTPFDCAIKPGAEAEIFLQHLEDTLADAWWPQVDWNSGIPGIQHFGRDARKQCGLWSASGVLINMHPENVQALSAAANALASALIAEGISVAVWNTVYTANASPNAIHINIGEKPIFVGP